MSEGDRSVTCTTMEPNQLFGACAIALFELSKIMTGYRKHDAEYIAAVKNLTAESCPPETLQTFCSFIVHHRPGDGTVKIHKKQLYAVLRIAVASLENLIADCDAGCPSAIDLARTCIATGWHPKETMDACRALCNELHEWEEWITIIPVMAH